MLKKTKYSIENQHVDQALHNLPNIDFKLAINEPSGNFFYDPWNIKAEYKNTIWNTILQTLPEPIGEARIIILSHSRCYQAHADIDDRYHLNLSGTDSYLIDLEDNVLHKLVTDLSWYQMDAGRLHSAVNFGRDDRVQLVVRRLLNNTTLKDPKKIEITFQNLTEDHARFLFDRNISPWLNRANKKMLISNFAHSRTAVTFDLEKCAISDLKEILPKDFRITQ
jgi:hypothetical protein